MGEPMLRLIARILEDIRDDRKLQELFKMQKKLKISEEEFGKILVREFPNAERNFNEIVEKIKKKDQKSR